MVLRQSFDNPIARRFTHIANQDHISDSYSSSESSESVLQESSIEIKKMDFKEQTSEDEYMDTQEEMLEDQIEEQRCIRSMTIIVIVLVWALNTVSLYSQIKC